jgi:hypothetical protein
MEYTLTYLDENTLGILIDTLPFEIINSQQKEIKAKYSKQEINEGTVFIGKGEFSLVKPEFDLQNGECLVCDEWKQWCECEETQIKLETI